MQMTDVSKLAQDKGCALKVVFADDMFFCWIENSHFVGKPFTSLDELVNFLHALPKMRTEESDLCSMLT